MPTSRTNRRATWQVTASARSRAEAAHARTVTGGRTADLQVLHQHPGCPIDGRGVRLRREFESLDLNDVIKDLMLDEGDSKDWWPADFGTTGAVHPDGVAPRRQRTASATAAAAPGSGSSASRRSTAGRTMRARQGRRLLWPISGNTAKIILGRPYGFSPATSPSSRWA